MPLIQPEFCVPLMTRLTGFHCIRKKHKENTHTDWFKIVFLYLTRKAELAQAVDIMMAQTNIIDILDFNPQPSMT